MGCGAMNQVKLEDITLNHFKILKAVDECHGFSNAAKKPGYSQALISKKVKQLEDYFGVRLLTRYPGSISLTSKGKQLIAQTDEVIKAVGRLQREFKITLNFEGEEIVLGVTPLLSAIWFQDYLHRFSLCFPGSLLREEIVPCNQSLSNANLSHIDVLLNSNSAYREDHHCTRLETYSFLLVSFAPCSELDPANSISINQIDFRNIVLLEEIYKELAQNKFLNKGNLDRASVLTTYQDTIRTAIEEQRLTILPDFCRAHLERNYDVRTSLIPDVNEYGIYIHVPKFSEPLVVAEGLVRSFRLDQEKPDHIRSNTIMVSASALKEQDVVRVGIQQDSVGQLIAGYGVKYVSDLLRNDQLTLPLSLSSDRLSHQTIEIDRKFDLQISLFSSAAALNRQMKRGNLDICVLDDTALLSNGSYFFHDSSFGSKLIGIASYNFLGHDISIVLPKNSPIKSVYDLRGRRVSTWFGSNAHRFIIILLDYCGIDLDTECTLVDEDPHTGSASLAHHRIDAYVCCETFAVLMEECASVKRLPQQTSNIQIPSLRGIVCRSQFMKENPESVMAYLHDLIVTNHWFLANPMKAGNVLSQLTNSGTAQIFRFFNLASGNRLDPTLKPQWSYLLKTLNRRLEGRYGISKFDVDFWIDDYLLRLVYSLLDLDYHFHQVSFSDACSNGYFLEEKFNRYMEVIHTRLAS